MNVEGFPYLKDVLLVEGLKANLISIRQLCDDDLRVSFDKLSCEVLNRANTCVMEGIRSKDNCYMFHDQSSLHVKVD